MKKLLIAGVGGFGREVFQWASDFQNKTPKWREIKFLIKSLQEKDDLALIEQFHLPYETEEEIKLSNKEEIEIVCAIGDPNLKLSVCNELEKMGLNFVTLIHPTAVVGRDCEIGKGVIICPGAVITTNVKIGNFVSINCLSSIGHDVVVEEGCTISSQCDITGSVYIERGVFLGSGARILPKGRVGRYAKVGAGSVVLRRVKPNSTVFGNPAREI
ncbi:acetyltransferase [Clostridium formicaceticum]|uniref:Acetyltransferase EpsM n=1 Tax=Clostridium formicaceticum TaxID=1497 RepID=A0AAC9WET2_9CLOT|nr:acetyltransferase [Clostridium formicaceticum]AOY75650.1 hypothetical protein BJL90_06930 [Clostridium formicaceticum]ARE85964.1 Putative acetyltransferase EpsM [Clostridium formicaceticum]